jgi:hypothetical protein
MIPLVAGIMAGAMGSGIAISRTGKYKAFPLTGIALMVTALLSMSFIVEADTSVWALAPFMVLLGVGLGFNFQPVILAVQNAVSPREMGVATSSVTFFRQMGGTIGVAAFLSILFTRLPGDIEAQIETAVRADPELAPQFRQLGAAATDLSDTSFIQRLPDAVAYPFKAGFSDSIDAVFLIAALVVAIGFFVFLFLPQLALSEKSGIQALQEDAADTPAPDDATGQVVHAAGTAAPTSTPPPTASAGDPRS